MRSMKRPHLKHFEALAQRLLEGRPSLRGGEQATVLAVATHLARALEDSQRQGETANCFEVALHPETLQALRDEEPMLEQRLSRYLQKLGRRNGIALDGDVTVSLLIDETFRQHQVEVVGSRCSDGGNTTTHVHNRQGVVSLEQLRALDAFLIIN
ncbi:MAG TPA: FhaA domain-containing protein, partial [Candidatus Sulfomarinibacteraceae bacterium]|nr:FhaA domain-containing protein [Candidatus Sulfomarinibacteraceae bacterium]